MIGDLFLIYLLSVVCTAAFENQLSIISSWIEIKIFGK